MVKEKALTKSELVSSLKELGIVTESKLREVKVVTKDVLYETLAQFYQEMLKPEFKEVKEAINNMDKRLIDVESEVKFLRQDVQDLSNEFVNYIPRNEFEKFKASLQS